MTMSRHSVRALVREFWQALANPYTYSLHRNVDAVFGLLWGLPIPIFTLAIHFHAAGLTWNAATAAAVLVGNPIYLMLIVHPVLFSIIFGALGSMRLRRDAQIKVLISDLEKHCDNLCQSNEKLTELDQLKNQFLANVTHELKSPLVTALGYSDRILNEKLGGVTERQRHALEISKRNLLRLRAMIEDILDFSRLEAGIGRLNPGVIDLKHVLQIAVSDKLTRAQDMRVRLSAELPAGSVLVQGDEARLTQAIENLVENALKFSSPGKTVRIGVHNDENDGWHITVRDEGPGIAAEVMPRLFQAFSQADNSASRPYNGVGLGLVIVRKIIEGHGGKVWLESQPGAGTTAHILLPKETGQVRAQQEVTYAANSTH